MLRTMDDQIVPKPQKRHWRMAVVATVIVAAISAINLAANPGYYSIPVTTALMFAPTLIAASRRHRNATAIFVCNLIVFGLVLSTGWLSFGGEVLFIYAGATVGTVITMVWAFVTNQN